MSKGVEPHLTAKQQGQADHPPQAGYPTSTGKGHLVVYLEDAGHPQCLPTGHAIGRLVFTDLPAGIPGGHIHQVDQIESCTTFQYPRPEIQLMQIVGLHCRRTLPIAFRSFVLGCAFCCLQDAVDSALTGRRQI